MKVWVVQAGLRYEPATFTAVRSTEDKADRLAEKLEADSSYE